MSELVANLPRDRKAGAGEPGIALFVGLVLLITFARWVGQHFSVVDIDVDEAQYWDWSRALALGYFSKPPLIAWVNAAAGLACGEGIACIRFPAPLFYFGTSLLVYAAADEMYGGTVAFWAGLTAALAPGISFSTRIMTTDVLLLFFWALALLAYVKLLRGGGGRWAVLLAVALGLGLLAKYAMAYFIAGILLAGLVSRDARALLRSRRLWLAIVVGVLMLTPNILWNLDNGFATARATAGYAAGGGSHFNLRAAIGFLGSQFGVAGPITFGVLLGLFARSFGPGLSEDDRVLLAFATPPLVIVVANALYSGQANANWAAPAIVSAFIVTAAYLVRGNWRRLLLASIGIGVAVQAVLLLADPFADRLTMPGVARGDIYRRTMGWRLLGEKVGSLASEAGAASIAAEGRSEVSTLSYYLRDDSRPIFIWSESPRPTNHFELTRPLTSKAPGPVLMISSCPNPDRYRGLFDSVVRLPDFQIPSGPTTSRAYSAFVLAGARGTIGPLPPCR